MPTAQHPQAKFDPIPPDLDLPTLVDRTPNFQWVARITAAQIQNIGPQEFEKLVVLHVVLGGKPLVIEKWNRRLPKDLFGPKWLEEMYNKKQENVRDIVGQCDIPMTTGHYLRSMKQLTNQWTPENFRDERRQRLYLKDIDCPPEWHEYLQKKVIPPNLFYMNENVDERSPMGQSDDDFDMLNEGTKSIAPAGDLMSSLPEPMRAQNLMCYIGHEGTYTPAHREMCASLGQNIMVDASGDENGEKPGSSIWFMTESKDREVVREYFLSMLGHDIEIEKHFAQINAWKKATFPVYIVEQKAGDFVLVPPLAPHQVWNRGTRTIKVAWNRTTVETLKMALEEALPKARLVCRDEQYKNKAIIYYTLEKYSKLLTDMERTSETGLLGFGQDLIKNSSRTKQLTGDFKALFELFTRVLVDEIFGTKEKEVEYIEFDSCVTCSYCRANIFNRFLTCKHCVRQLVGGDEDTYDICMECYVMGRSCLCISNLTWCEQWHWQDLVEKYEDWRALIIKHDGFVDINTSPLPLELARKRYGKKTVAQLCQEQLRRRPWKDISKVDKPKEPAEDSEVEVDENGRPKKKRRGGRKAKKGDVYRCHVCQHKDYTYKLAFCSNEGCNDAYCYGVLYRAFDQMPQEVMQNERWQCPKCLGICNCGACRKAKNGVPYIPKKTLLGHDTRPIADDRSVELLIDFKIHNLSWLKNAGDETRALSSKRMQRLREAADAEKAKSSQLENDVLQLPDGALADSLEEAALQQALINGGYGEQPTVLGVSREHPPHQNGHTGPAEVADMSIVEDQSAYPDPSGLGPERGLGMGYYEQDDSEDRILFDPYQQPSVESLMALDDEPEPAEYLKKQLRVAKRRARLEEDDDPDFRGPRSHSKKKAKTTNTRDGQADALNNMDPALFGDVTMVGALADGTPTEREAPAVQDPPNADVPDGPAQEGEEPRANSPNRPALRHARPKISYLVDENGEEEFNEILIPRSQRPQPLKDYNPADATKDPLDLASAAILAIVGGAAGASKSATRSPAPPGSGNAAVTGTGKRRGRPPGPRKSMPAGGSAEQTPSGHPKPTRKPPRDRTLPVQVSDDSDSDVDAQLAGALDGFDEDGEPIESRPQSRGGFTPVNAPKRRGRPPKNAQRGPSAGASGPAAGSPFMSMADRMKAKGKKFKIASRKSKAAQDSTPAGQAASRSVSCDVDTPTTPTADKEPERPTKATRGRFKATPAQDFDIDMADADFDPNAAEEAVSEASSPRASPSPSMQDYMEPMDTFMPSPSPVRDVPREPTVILKTQTPEPKREPTPAHDVSPSPSPSPSPAREASPTPAHSPPHKPSPSPYHSPSPPPPPPKPTGPTIVRLVSSDEEGSEFDDHDHDDGNESQSESRSASESESESEPEEQPGRGRDPLDPSDSDDSDSDDEDIPAVKQVVSTATRGGRRGGMVGLAGRGAGTAGSAGRGGATAGRGRGRGRGRPRGRGHYKWRGGGGR
ncbi:hypothetical protein QC764_305340 [Podospora pseudoanserina]|uniref:JmjC domain-containing protein n=1 Tax=Podospora pseudoanserina TaxID=2609844 RepID=A0ABR0IE98_9PEZI|nr:hypothetical protein QC764_305340 [Podospora pseudoanserina]